MPDSALISTRDFNAPLSLSEPLSRSESLNLSGHALERMQQRAVRQDDVLLALKRGRVSHSHGARRYTLTDRALRFAARGADLEVPRSRLDRLRGLCVVVGEDGVIVTVMWDAHFAKRPGVMRGRRLRASATDFDA